MLATRYAERLLANRISDADYDRMKSAATAAWDPAVVADPASDPAIRDVVYRRHDRTLTHVLPWLEAHRLLDGRRLVDFGSGCGSSALASSYFASEVRSFEIDPISVAAFRTRMAIFDRQNVHVTLADPSVIADAAIEAVRPGDVVLLLAVVEHLTESEQYFYLKKFWDALAPGDVLVIVETPNRLAYLDTHTHKHPFYHQLPDETFFNYLEHVAPSSLRFRDNLLSVRQLQGTASASTLRRRLGLGVSYHEFEIAFGCDLNEVTLSDGFDEPMRGMFHLSIDDQLCVTAFEQHGVNVPIGFARSVLSFVFQKPASVNAANDLKQQNLLKRQAIFNEFALTPKRG